MCCLFGLLDYKRQMPLEERQHILRTLSIACEARGTDATGIAYFKGPRLYIQKAPRAAHRMKFHVAHDAHYIMGHTRMTTQGNERVNYNNHPFSGRAGDTSFALAHNGVINNDVSLRKSRKLPATRIETDSYIAVQLLERDGVIDFDSLRCMAETLRGSFTVTVLDAKNDLYIVRGNNPMCIYHFEEAGFYLYASTEEILDKAIRQLHMDRTPHKRVELTSGEILRISADGSRKKAYFNDAALWSMPIYSVWGWPMDDIGDRKSKRTREESEWERQWYYETMEYYARASGYDIETLCQLHDAGYGLLDIEEMAYDPELMEACLAELMTANTC